MPVSHGLAGLLRWGHYYRAKTLYLHCSELPDHPLQSSGVTVSALTLCRVRPVEIRKGQALLIPGFAHMRPGFAHRRRELAERSAC